MNASDFYLEKYNLMRTAREKVAEAIEAVQRVNDFELENAADPTDLYAEWVEAFERHVGEIYHEVEALEPLLPGTKTTFVTVKELDWGHLDLNVRTRLNPYSEPAKIDAEVIAELIKQYPGAEINLSETVDDYGTDDFDRFILRMYAWVTFND